MPIKGTLTNLIAGFLFLHNAFCQPVPVKIGISKASNNYLNWLKRSDPDLVLVNFYMLSIQQALLELSTCDGLLLTGGEDVYPGRYGKEYDTSRCTEMNPHRDSLEMALIAKALAGDLLREHEAFIAARGGRREPGKA